MSLEQHVTSLDLSKRLYELDKTKVGLFQWCFHAITGGHDYVHLTFDGQGIRNCGVQYLKIPAFLASELGEIIRSHCNEWAQGYDDSGCFYHFQYGNRGAGCMIPGIGKSFSALDAENEVDARAEFVIHLVEKGIMQT